MNFLPDYSAQQSLFGFSVRDMVPDDCDVWLYIELFDSLDLMEFDCDYSSQGGAAIAPVIMLRTIFYGLTHGIASGRKLAEYCRHDTRFMVLSGEIRPTARAFQKFLVRHEKRFGDLFTSVVQLAQQMELVKLGNVSIDGSRFKANTSKHKAMSHAGMERALKQINAELSELRASLQEENAEDLNEMNDGLPAEIKRREVRLAKITAAKNALEAQKGDRLKPKDQKSFNDHDALPMGGRSKGFEYGYNCQAAVDSESQIVVGATVHDNQNDTGSASDLLQDVERTCGDNAETVLADSGYCNDADLQAIETHGAQSLVSTGKGEGIASSAVADELVPGSEPHEFRCINNKPIPVKSKHNDGSTTLEFNGRFCNGCPMKDFCSLKGKKGKAFKVPPAEKHERRRANRNRVRSEEGRHAYRKRKAIVEPVFGNIKNKGLKIFVTGKDRVTSWWKIVTTAHNIEKIIGSGRPVLSTGASKLNQGALPAT